MYVPGSPSLRIVPPTPPQFHVVRLAFDKQTKPQPSEVTVTRFEPKPAARPESKLERMQAQHEFDHAVRTFWWAAL